MTEASKGLILAGFMSKSGKDKLGELKGDELRSAVAALSDEDAEKYASHHEMELVSNQICKMPYPEPIRSYHLIYETFAKPLESVYFWCLNQFEDWGCPIIDKITDVFSASEQSTFFGISQQRLGFQQDKVAQYLASVGKMVKDLFQIVREIKIIDERLEYYEAAESDDRKVREPAEIALKGLFVDLVEGGSKSPASVYGLARDVQFITLPDLFFSIHPRKKEEIKDMVDKLEFNRKVKEVLERKLWQYLNWRESTHKELITRKSHTVKYLRQHYEAIQLYLTWIKPYLKQVQRLTVNQEKLSGADLIAAFETSTIEIEILGRMMPTGNKAVYNCCLLTLNYRTSPEVHQAEEYQRRIVHRGKIDIQWRGYSWTEDQIKAYKKMRDEETFKLVSKINESVQDAMKELGDDLNKYLSEQEQTLYNLKGEKKKEDDKKEKAKAPQLQGIFDPFLAPFQGVSEIFGSMIGESEAKKEAAKGTDVKKEEGDAKKGTIALTWNHYKLFKKAHKMITW